MDENSDSDSDLDDLFSYLKSSRNKNSKEASATAYCEDDKSEVPANESVDIANAETKKSVQNECAIYITNKAENTGSTIKNEGQTIPNPDNEESLSQNRYNRYYFRNENDWNAFCEKREMDQFETTSPNKYAVDGTHKKDIGSKIDTKRKEISDIENKHALEYIAPKYRKEPLTMSHIETIIKSSPSKPTGLCKKVHFPNVDKEVESQIPHQALIRPFIKEKNDQGRVISPRSSPIEIVYVRVLENENTTDGAKEKLSSDNNTQNELANKTRNDSLKNYLERIKIVEPATKRVKLSSTLEQGVQNTQALRRFVRKKNKSSVISKIENKLDTEVYVVKYKYGSRIFKPDKLGDKLEQRYYNYRKKKNNRIKNEELCLKLKEKVEHSNLSKISDSDIKVENNNLEVEMKNVIADKSQKSTKSTGSETEAEDLALDICNSSFIESSCKTASNVEAESSANLITSYQMQGKAVTEKELCDVKKSILKKKVLLVKPIKNKIAAELKTKRCDKSKWPTKETVTKFKRGSNMITQVRVSFNGTNTIHCHESESIVESKTVRPPCVQPGINRDNENVNVSPFNNDPIADKTVRNEGIEPAVKCENNDNVVVQKLEPLSTIAKKTIQPNSSVKPNRSAEKSVSKLTKKEEPDETEKLKTLIENGTTKITKNKVGRPRKKLPDNVLAEKQNDTSAEISQVKRKTMTMLLLYLKEKPTRVVEDENTTDGDKEKLSTDNDIQHE